MRWRSVAEVAVDELAPEALLRRSSPLIVRGATRDWPALRRWTPDHLKARFHGEPVSCMKARSDVPDGYIALGSWHDGSGGRQVEVMPFEQYMEQVWASSRPRTYLRAALAGRFDELLADVAPPPGVDPARVFSSTIWLGAAGTIAPVHYDPADNYHGVVIGRKRFVLFDRAESSRLYPHAVFSRYFAHTSRILDIERADRSRYPRVAELEAHEAVLEAGDALFLPASWWHQVVTLAPSIAVNFWWHRRSARFTRSYLRLRLAAAYQRASRATTGWMRAIGL
jgi:hypothetical protein